LADLRPGQSRLACPGDEPLDQDVAEVCEVAADVDRDAEPTRGRLVGHARLDKSDELVDRGQARFAHASIST
jgi:hypothetical protein